MPVNTTHTEYDKVCPKWDLVRSIVSNDAKRFIRTVDKNDPVRSAQYKNDAILTNFTRLTQVGLTGLVFRRPAKIDLAKGLEYMLEDATGYDFGLEQFAQQIIGEVLVTGRYGILVDYPQGVEGESYARFKPYTAENIINWKHKDIGSETELTLLVLKEKVCVDGVDMFDHTYEDQYRVLYLNDAMEYHQAVYDHRLELVSDFMPVDYHGKPFDCIPFSFIGSENNDACVDSIPLYDLAVINLGHYRNSADLEETAYICGQVVPVLNIGEADQQSYEAMNPGGISIGSRKAVITTSGGDFKFIQAAPNVLPRELMTDKETQAAAIGARLITPAGGRETAEAAKIRYGAQNSALYIFTRNVSLAIEELLEYAAEFMMEVPKESTFELNSQFYEDAADPNLIAQQIMLLDRGAMSIEEVRDGLKNVGVLKEEVSSDIDPNLLINPLADVDPDVTA